MSWQVVSSPASLPDFRALAGEEGAAVVDELFSWVDGGPPAAPGWTVGGVVIFDVALPHGYTISYFLDEEERYIAVIRLRRTSSG